MGAFQDFIRGFAQSSNQFPAAMAERYRREQASATAAKAEEERKRADVLQRLGLFIQAAQGGADVQPAPDVESFLGTVLQRPQTQEPLGVSPEGLPIQGPLEAPTEAPWTEVFAPKAKYVNTARGVYKQTRTGLELIPGTEKENRKVPVRTKDGYALVDPEEGTYDVLEGLTAPATGGGERSAGISLRSFNSLAKGLGAQAATGAITKEEANAQIRAAGTRLEIDPSLVEDAVATTNQMRDRLPISSGDTAKIQGSAKVEDIGLQLLAKLDNPKVIEGLGRIGGFENTLKAAITGNDPSAIAPELLAYWSQFGIYLDNIIRSWSGAQINEQEAARIADILGGKYRDAGGMKIAIREMIKNARDTQASVYKAAQQKKEGIYKHADRGPETKDYDLLDKAEFVAEYKKQKAAGSVDDALVETAKSKGWIP